MLYLKNKFIVYHSVFILLYSIAFLGNNSLFAQAQEVDTTNNTVDEDDGPGATARNNGPVDPGEGYAPLLTDDIEGNDGVFSFVAQKPAKCTDEKNCCEKLVIALTPAAIADNVSVELNFHTRYPENLKWQKKDEEKQIDTITPKTPEELITIVYNHAGHRGVHGGATARDTHHNWQLRLLRNGIRIPFTSSLWEKYLRVLFSTADHTLEETYSGEAGLISNDDENSEDTNNQEDIGAYLTAEEIDNLVNWGFFTDDEQIEILQAASVELHRLNEIEAENQTDTISINSTLVVILGTLGMMIVKDLKDHLGPFAVLKGIKTAFSASRGCSSSSSNLTIDKDSAGNIIRYNVILAK